MNQLEEVVKTLKSLVGEGVEAALKYLEKILSPDSARFNDYIQIKSRYNSLQRELLLGTIDHSTYDQARNAISNALLILTDDLLLADLRSEAKAAAAADKRGDILYHIPDEMQLNREEKCSVRVAWIRENLLRDWQNSAVDVVKDIRVSEIMGVELLNVDERNPFLIRTLSEKVQFVDKDDFTEWIFYIKPVIAGEFTLALRVSVIEMINNKEYKKDIVLEEKIVVRTQELPPADETAFKTAQETLVLGAASAPQSPAAPAAPSTMPGSPPPPKVRPPAPPAPQGTRGLGEPLPSPHPPSPRSVSRLLAFALVATGTLAAAGLFGWRHFEQERLWNATLRCGRPLCLRGYLERYPDGRHSAEALQMLSDTLVVTPDTTVSTPPVGVVDTPRVQDTAVAEPLDIQDEMPAPAPPPPAKSTKPPAKPPAKTPQKNKPTPARPAPSAPQPLGPPPPPSGLVTKPIQNDPDLRGKVFYFTVPEFGVVKQGRAQIDLQFLKFNEFREVLVILTGTNIGELKPEQPVELVTASGRAYRAGVLYVSALPSKKNRYKAYFKLTGANLEGLASEVFSAIRITEPASGQTRAYAVRADGQRLMKTRAEAALKQIAEKTAKN